jgi:DNA-binding transcriptional LysR family regulator
MIYIRSMNLSAFDLNLLVALDALLLEANVSRAAMRIGLSQPATSHALQRLRDILGDPLLVRVGARMELTPRAQGLRGPLAQTLDQVRGLFIPDDFDAASSERHFRLMMPDLAVELLVPPLMEKITALAPKIQLDIVPWRGPAIFTAEFARTIDLVISIGDAFKGFYRQLLYSDRDAIAVRRGHPLGAKLGRRDVFLEARHVAVIIRGQNVDLIDDWLRTKRIERRICAGRARLYRGAAYRGAHRPCGIRPPPADISTRQTIVADGGHAAARPRHRRTVHVLPDAGPVRSRLDLAAQHHARRRP